MSEDDMGAGFLPVIANTNPDLVAWDVFIHDDGGVTVEQYPIIAWGIPIRKITAKFSDEVDAYCVDRGWFASPICPGLSLGESHDEADYSRIIVVDLKTGRAFSQDCAYVSAGQAVDDVVRTHRYLHPRKSVVAE